MNVIPDTVGMERLFCGRCSGTGEVIEAQTAGGRALLIRQCPSCEGRGVIIYRRGSGLVPLIPRKPRVPI